MDPLLVPRGFINLLAQRRSWTMVAGQLAASEIPGCVVYGRFQSRNMVAYGYDML